LPPPQPVAAAPGDSQAGLADLFGPDSDSNMETIAEADVPAFLDRVPTIRPSSPAPDVTWDPPVPSPAMDDEEEPPIELRQYIIAATAGVLVAAVLAGCAFLLWRMLWAQPRAGSSAMVDDPALARPDVPGPRATAARTPAGDALIAFRVSPTTATLFVDGQPLPPPGRTLPRVEHGHTLALLVHADGYEDERMQIDESVHGTVDVVLTPRRP